MMAAASPVCRRDSHGREGETSSAATWKSNGMTFIITDREAVEWLTQHLARCHIVETKGESDRLQYAKRRRSRPDGPGN